MDHTVIYYDNQSCIKIFENPIFRNRYKHINIRYHHIWDCVQRRIMLLEYIPIEEQDVDILTKEFSKWKFNFHIGRIGVVYNPFFVERECWKWQQENPDLIFPWIKLGENCNSTSQDNKNEWIKLNSICCLN